MSVNRPDIQEGDFVRYTNPHKNERAFDKLFIVTKVRQEGTPFHRDSQESDWFVDCEPINGYTNIWGSGGISSFSILNVKKEPV